MNSLSFGFVNIFSVNQPPVLFGPNVGPTTLTNRASGPAFTERQFLEALKYRKPPPPPPRKLTAAEKAQREFQKAESQARSLPVSLYGTNDSANADAVRENLKHARQNRDHEYYMEIVNKAWSEFKSKKN